MNDLKKNFDRPAGTRVSTGEKLLHCRRGFPLQPKRMATNYVLKLGT